MLKRLVSTILIFVIVATIPSYTFLQVSCASQEITIGFDISKHPTPDCWRKMDWEELYAFPGTGDCSSETPTPCSGDDPVVYTVVVVDDTMKSTYEDLLHHPVSWSDVEEWAYNILENGDDPFWSNFEINFFIVHYEHWTIGEMSLLEELSLAQTTFDWPDAYPGYYDCMVIMSANHDGNYVGWSELLGDAFAMSVTAAAYLMPLHNLFQHEASHLYGAPDHEGWEGLWTFCIMSYTWAPFTRAWCGGCGETIETNKYHFGE